MAKRIFIESIVRLIQEIDRRLLSILILAIFTPISVFSFGNKELKKYYFNVNKAELSIIDGNFQDAKGYYDTAFNSGYLFPVDLYNAFRLNYNLCDTAKSLQLFRILVLYGIDKEKFSLGFNQYDSTISEFYYFIENKYEDYKSDLKNIVELNFYANFLNKTFDQDQNCRRNYEKGFNLGACDKSIEDSFIYFVAKYGFPEFKRAGYLEENRIQPFNTGTLDVLLFHKRGGPNSKFTNLMLENLKLGKLDARSYMLRYFSTENGGYYVNIPIGPITKEELARADSLRGEIYLEPLLDYYKKIVYHRNVIKKNEYVFVNDFCRTFNGDNELQIINE